MNDYIKILKDNINGYNSTIKSINIYHRNDKERYSDSFLKEREKEYSAKKACAKQKIQQQIVDGFNNVKKTLSKASFVNVKTVCSDTYRMFHNDLIDLSPSEIQHFIDEARKTNDFTMLRSISEYCNKHNYSIQVPTVDTVLDGYKEFYEGALQLVDDIDGSAISDLKVTSFADEEFGKKLYDKVGSSYFPGVGALSDDYSHAYDDIRLKKDGRDFYSASEMAKMQQDFSNSLNGNV